MYTSSGLGLASHLPFKVRVLRLTKSRERGKFGDLCVLKLFFFFHNESGDDNEDDKTTSKYKKDGEG